MKLALALPVSAKRLNEDPASGGCTDQAAVVVNTCSVRDDRCANVSNLEAEPLPSVITLKPAIGYQFKTGQRAWPET
jgi:hypothetical protein